jgi:hypothetical protein
VYFAVVELSSVTGTVVDIQSAAALTLTVNPDGRLVIPEAVHW